MENILTGKRYTRCSCSCIAVELNVKAAGRQVCDLCGRSNGRKLRKQRGMRQRRKKRVCVCVRVEGVVGASEQCNNLQVL